MKTVIYHAADYDGIFCREIAKKFLSHDPNCDVNDHPPEGITKPCNCTNYIGWNFGDTPIPVPSDWNPIYVLDLPLDKPFGFDFTKGFPEGSIENPMYWDRVIWIDHHKSSIESHPTSIPGCRIDGVAACRLAWQWFHRASVRGTWELPPQEAFIKRAVDEPLAVRLAGEYDVWDKRDPKAEILQYGLRSAPLTPAGWNGLLANDEILVNRLLEDGAVCQRYAQSVDSGHMHASFIREWEGLKFLCLNGRGNSNTFASRDRAETGHDALLLFYFTGEAWLVSLYHAKHRTDLDLSLIAVKHGGGGHKGACGFTCKVLPFPVIGQ